MAGRTTDLIEVGGGLDRIREEARRDMLLYDALPEVLRRVMDDTGCDYASVEHELRYYMGRVPLMQRRDPRQQRYAAEQAAAEIRRLASMAHEQDLVDAAAALEENARRTLPKAHRRS